MAGSNTLIPLTPNSAAQQRAGLIDRLVLGIWVPALAAAVLLPVWLDAEHAGAWYIAQTIRVTLAGYFAAVWLMLRLRGDDWIARGGPGRLARWLWSIAWLTFVIHVALAYHFYHNWSHQHALDHTRQVSGWGEGIYISFLFNALWMADVVWWTSAPASYARRRIWIGAALHGLMAFIVFNGTVVYEAGPVRWVCLPVFIVLTIRWLMVYIVPRYQVPA